MSLKNYLKCYLDFLNFFNKINKKGKELLRIIKIIENEYSSVKILFKLVKNENLYNLFGYIQKIWLKRANSEMLEKLFYFQEKKNKLQLKLLYFFVMYVKICRNRLKPFLEISKLVFNQKNKKFFSGYFQSKEESLIKTFKFKKLGIQKTKNNLWGIIRTLKKKI